MNPVAARTSAPPPVVFRDAFGERRRIVAPAGSDTLDVLCLRGDLTAVPSFEFALRERVSRLASFRHPYFAHVRTVERLSDPARTLALISNAQNGVRLSEMLATAAKHEVVLDSDAAAFDRALKGSNHTLKRTLTDPHVFSGIGNAYSDEILHAAQLSPFRMSPGLTADESRRLYEATRATLRTWIDRLQEQAAGGFPSKVTAFHEEMAVHGRFGKPCPRCGSPVQRIVYASNEANYCATCQTEGRLLADRALSRLLRKDWPRTLEELERRRGRE